MGAIFFFESIFLGIGLAMDAFSVSLANGLNEPKMKKIKMVSEAIIFAFFQFLMPMLGWVCVHTVTKEFEFFERCVPYIALVLLVFIGGKMLLEGIEKNEVKEKHSVGVLALIVQGIATSIDALSVGFTISNYTLYMAFLCCTIIELVTFLICFSGIIIGKKFGTKLSNKASLLGGSILIAIGIEIFITGVFM